jgi:hypothetical protein
LKYGKIAVFQLGRKWQSIEVHYLGYFQDIVSTENKNYTIWSVSHSKDGYWVGLDNSGPATLKLTKI